MRKLMTHTLLADLMRERIAIALIFMAAATQLMLVGSGLPGWPCPLLQTTGYPCPGCGLSRAAMALLRGEWKTSLTLHAFAPLLLAVLVLLGLASLLPQPHRQKLICAVEKFEMQTGLSVLLSAGLIAYWVIRLLFPASLALVAQR
jgi:hypothetical protein